MKYYDQKDKSPTPSKAFGDSSNHTVSLDSAASERDAEGFQSLANQFSPTGHSLHYVEHSNSFHVERWGRVRELATLEDVRRLLLQIGGSQ